MPAIDGMHLYCFPYAGGSAAAIYASWRRQLPAWLALMPVELPGRGRRIGEPLHRRLDLLVRQLADEFTAARTQLPAWQAQWPFAFFGHSMGALLAYEVARTLCARGQAGPALLCVGGADAPSQRRDERLARLRTDQDVVEYLRELNGTPREVLDNPELLELMLPIIKADFAMCANYVHADGAALACPLHVIGGLRDTTSPQSLAAWQRHSQGGFSLDLLEGDHFFIHSAQQQLLAILIRAAQATAGPAAFQETETSCPG